MFSIIVNCSDTEVSYLENCLKGLLLQSYQNFEIVTILNIEKSCNKKNFLKNIIKKFKKEKKIKFFFTKKKLKINKSFRYGLELASREWILYCCADDGLLLRSLEILKSLIKKNDNRLICWSLLDHSYNHKTKIFKFNSRNYKNKSIDFYIIKTIKVLERIFEDMLIVKQKKILPFIPRAVFHRSIVNSKFLFGKSDPMAFSGLYNLLRVDSYLFLDLNLTIIGESDNSLSALHSNQTLFDKKRKNISFSKDIVVNNFFSKKIFHFLKGFNFSSFNRLSHLDYLYFCIKNYVGRNKIFLFNMLTKWKKKNHSNFILSILEELCQRKNINFFPHYFQLIKSLYRMNNLFNFIKYFFDTLIILTKYKVKLIINKIYFSLNGEFKHLDNMFLSMKFYSKFFLKKKIILINKGDYFEKNSTYR